jgi:hypothetical protein
MKYSASLWMLCTNFILAYSNEAVKELNKHFSLQESQIRTLGALLKRMKDLTRGKFDTEKAFDVCLLILTYV